VSRRPFRLGLVGAGRMGRTHIRALEGSRNVRITAVADPVAVAREQLAGSGLVVFSDVDALLAEAAVDGVLIAAPTDRHAEIVSQVAAAGFPILCEKPCGASMAQLRVAANAVEEHGVPMQVAYWRRYVPELQRLRDRIGAGDLGDIHLVMSFQWDGQPPPSTFRAQSGGIFVDMGVHEFDQVRWLTGQELGDLQVTASPLGGDAATGDPDSAQAVTGMSGGTTAFVSLGRYFPGGDMARVEVFGTVDAVRSQFLDPSDGERAQLDALLRQAEGFAAYSSGGPRTGATIDDAAAALAAAERARSQLAAMTPIVASA
jgi:myo-inositol 2-dehydrogenase / D-chiro-inositol 1-dehydrogenase